MYDTRQEFEQKLQGCVVLFGGAPTWIREVAGQTKKDLRLSHKLLRTKTVQLDLPDDPKWDFRTIGSRLGYTNVDFGDGSYRQSLYLTRMAIRQSSATQGLSQRNVAFETLKPQPRLGLSSYKMSWVDMINYPFLWDTLERKYPDYKSVVSDFSKETLQSKSWNPDFAVYRPDVGPFYLMYKDKKVGHSDDPGYKWRLGTDFDYLKETLEYLDVRTA